MLKFSATCFLKYTLRVVSLILICIGVTAQRPEARPAVQAPTGKEPIAYIGHGAMFDQKGQEVAPTLGFIREAQAWYRADLVERLTALQRAEFEKYERGLREGLRLDEQSQLVLSAHLLDWLIDAAKTEDRD